ncbi:hypothetical protein [Larkinella sp. C7]|jgi:hypothetical protein|uniref:hypothetical protein n=1 Tax=Larkinella sp. C7 TaxID=2576607 RepID=UPI001111073A|nr:hypothetical protein [Larkinella sp. C7]
MEAIATQTAPAGNPDFQECVNDYYSFDFELPKQNREVVQARIERVEACRKVLQDEMSQVMKQSYVPYQAKIESRVWQIAQLNDYLASYAYYLAYGLLGK